MEVTYELTPEDVWHYNQYYLRTKAPFQAILINNPSFITKVGFVLACLGLLTCLYAFADALIQHRNPEWSMLFGPLILVCVIPRLLPPTKKRLAKIAMQQPGFLCEHFVSISPEWLAEKTSVNDTKIAWTIIVSIEENQAYFFLFISKNVAYIVPKRAFSSHGEANTFLDRARSYWDAAKNGTPIGAEDAVIWPPAPRPGA